MRFESFHWLSHHDCEPLYRTLYEYGKRTRDFFGCFYFILVFYIWGAFLIKQLFHSRLFDMRGLYPTRRYASCWLSTISYPTRARVIIVNCSHSADCDLLKIRESDWLTSREIWCLPFQGGTPRKNGWRRVARFPKPSPYLWSKSAISPTLYAKIIPYLWPKWPNSIPYLWLKRSKNHTLWGHTYLYSLYKG